MLIFPRIKKLKFKRFTKSKRERYNSLITPKNFENQLKSNNNFPSIISISPTNNPNIDSYKKKNNNNKYYNNNPLTVFSSGREKKFLNQNLKNQIKIINYRTEKLKAEKEIKGNTIEFNNESKDKKLFLTFREDYNNLTNIIYNKPINVNKFIEKINSFLLPNDKTFEIMKNIVNNELKSNKETSKNNTFNQLLRSKKIPINTYNSGLIFRCIIKNTFIEALKKALLNRDLIDRNDIKKEYQKQIDDIKIYLFINNNEKKDLTINKNFESSNIENNLTSLVKNLNNDKLYLDKNIDKKIKLQKHRQNRKIFQTNSSDNIYFNKEKNKNEIIDNKIINIDYKRKKSDNNNILASLPINNIYSKEVKKTNSQRVILKMKMDINKENRLRNIIKGQKITIDDHIKIKEKIEKAEDKLIKTENSEQKGIKVFDFFSNNINNKNKNEDIIDYINDTEKSIKFGNSLIKEKNDKSSLKTILFDEKIIHKNLFNDIGKYNNQLNNKIIKENNSSLFKSENEQIKKVDERKRAKNNKKGIIIVNKKLFLKKKKTLNTKNFKDFLKDENYKPQLNELKNKDEDKINIQNIVNREALINNKEEEEKLLEESWEYQFNIFKNNIKRLKNMSEEEFIKDTLKFIK